MANRYFFQFQKTLEREAVKLYGEAAIAGTGAVTLNRTNSKGIASMARTGAGAYTITLQDQYFRLLNLTAVQIFAGGLLASPDMAIASEDVDGAKTINVVFSVGGVATDPDNGAVIKFEISLSNTNYGY